MKNEQRVSFPSIFHNALSNKMATLIQLHLYCQMISAYFHLGQPLPLAKRCAFLYGSFIPLLLWQQGCFQVGCSAVSCHLITFIHSSQTITPNACRIFMNTVYLLSQWSQAEIKRQPQKSTSIVRRPIANSARFCWLSIGRRCWVRVILLMATKKLINNHLTIQLL